MFLRNAWLSASLGLAAVLATCMSLWLADLAVGANHPLEQPHNCHRKDEGCQAGCFYNPSINGCDAQRHVEDNIEIPLCRTHESDCSACGCCETAYMDCFCRDPSEVQNPETCIFE